MSELTKQDFLEKYGHYSVKFDHYEKFTFNYKAYLPNGNKIFISCGGNALEIYNNYVQSDERGLIKNLDPFKGFVTKGGKEVDSFYDC